MQDLTGTSIAANAAKAERQVTVNVEVQWNGEDWTAETGLLKSLTWDWRFAPPEEGVIQPGRGYANEAVLTLYNELGRFSPYKTTSPLYAEIAGGAYYLAGVRAYVGFEGETLRVFSGYLFEIRQPTRAGNAVFICRDRAATILQQKATTAVYTGLRTDEWLNVLCDLVGIDAGDRVFDTGLAIIPYVWLEDESVWEQMALAAAAEGGMLYFDWAGKLHFENGAHWVQAAHQSSVYTLTRATFADVTPQHRPEEVYNEVIVEYSPRVVGPVQEVFSLDTPIVIPPSGTAALVARLSHPVTALYSPQAGYDYICTLATGDQADSTLSIQNDVDYAQRYEADLVNTSASHTLIVQKFRLMGTPLIGEPSGEARVTGTSVVSHTRTLRVTKNPLVQTAGQATMLASFLADRFKNPRSVFEVTGVPGLPYLELGDRVTLQDSRLGLDTTALVVGVAGKLSPVEPFTTDLTLIQTVGLLQSTAYFTLGTSKWGTGAGYGELWYGGAVEASWTELPDAATGDILSAAYLNTLVANLNHVHGLLMAAEPATCWYFGSAGNPASAIFKGVIWHQHRYLRHRLLVGGGTCTVKVNGTAVVTSGSDTDAVADLNSLGLTVGEFYTVTVEATADNTYIVELAEQADATASPTAPTFPTFSDGATSAASDLNAVRDGIAWLYARARNPVLPHVGRYGTNRPSSWTEDEFPDNYRLVWRGTVRHRHNTLKGRLRYWPAVGRNLGKVQVRVRVDGGDAGEHYVTKTAGSVENGQVEDFTLSGLTGLSAMELARVEVYARHELATTSVHEVHPDGNGDLIDNLVTTQGDDGSTFGPVWLYEDAGNAAIASWTALPTFAHLDKPTAANLNKFKTDGDLLAAVARYANRPTPLLTDGTLQAHEVHLRHTWRWLKYQTRYTTTDGVTTAQAVKLSWSTHDVTLPDSGEGEFATYDLAQAEWLVRGAFYRIENAVYVLETPIA